MAEPAHEAPNLVRFDVLSRRRDTPVRGGPRPALAVSAEPQLGARIQSIDALRGFSMFCILGADGVAWSLRELSASYGGLWSALGGFIGDQFDHVAWEGLRFYDFIFPLFLFVTGVSIVLSLPRLVEREGKATAHVRMVRRSLILFGLGVLYYGGLSQPWPDIRLSGVLQRIALCYFFASLLFLNLRIRGIAAAFLVLLTAYWALMTFVPVPGIGAGSFAPDANLANWVDAHYLPGKLWDGTRDPEGLLSTLPAIATCLLGVFAGLLLKSRRWQPREKSLYLLGTGLGLLAAGYLWGIQFPIIKALWTSSFVLVTGGYSFVLLGFMHQVIDVWSVRAWARPLIWIGANAITLYFLNNVASFDHFATRLVGGDVSAFLDRTIGTGGGRLVTYGVGLVLAVIFARLLYQRRLFLRV